jgi:error-prone DNA polymerase
VLIRQVIGAVSLHALAGTALLAIGGILVIERQLTLGQLVAAELIVSGVLTSFAKFGKQLESFYDLMAGVDKLGHLLDLPLEREFGEPVPTGGPAGAALALHELGFVYESGAVVLRELSARTGIPLVAAGDVHMHVRSRKKLQDTLTAIRLRTPLARCGRQLLPNAERYLRPLYRLARIYPADLLAETLAIAERCNFSLDELRYEYPEEIVPAGETPTTYLRRATYEEARRRYPHGMPENVRATVEHELQLIADLKYEPYFLTVYDIVRFARSQDILCQGRGSAANSAVCYCLGITEVDPARMSVLFERFISKERNEPPDIDVDFEHQRREEVMQYIYTKYGRHRAALTAALHTYRPRGALSDVGKALGLSLDQVDRLAGRMAWWDGKRIKPERLAEAGFDPASPVIAQLVELVHELIGFPRHLSQHSGGFVIARDRLDRLVPIENAAMADRTVIQWDKDDLDALGLLKIDVLALGMLSCVRRALAHIESFYPDPVAQVRSASSPRRRPEPKELGSESNF